MEKVLGKRPRVARTIITLESTAGSRGTFSPKFTAYKRVVNSKSLYNLIIILFKCTVFNLDLPKVIRKYMYIININYNRNVRLLYMYQHLGNFVEDIKGNTIENRIIQSGLSRR